MQPLPYLQSPPPRTSGQVTKFGRETPCPLANSLKDLVALFVVYIIWAPSQDQQILKHISDP